MRDRRAVWRQGGALLVLATALGCGASSDRGGDAADGSASPVDGAIPSDGASGDATTPVSDGGVTREAGADGSPFTDGAAPRDAGGEGGIADAAQAIAVPVYVDPSSGSAWTQEIGAAPTVRLLVANPSSGPGAAVDSTYAKVISDAIAAHVTIVGYVHTSYGARAAADVHADVDAWYAFYPSLEGIFLDEVSSDAATATSYYAPLYTYVKGKGAASLVIVNPGAIPDEAYMSASDVVVSFEDTYANYTNGTYPPNRSWIAKYDRFRFWHLVLSATSSGDMQNAIAIARQRNVGYVYVTDQGPATAYSQLVTGAYWSAELAAASAP